MIYMTTNNNNRPINYTTVWSQLHRLDFFGLGVAVTYAAERAAAATTVKSQELWMGRFDRIQAYLRTERGAVARRDDLGRWMVGRPSDFLPIEAGA